MRYVAIVQVISFDENACFIGISYVTWQMQNHVQADWSSINL